MKTNLTRIKVLTILSTLLHVSCLACSPNTPSEGPMAIGETVTGYPLSPVQDLERLRSLERSRDVLISIFWNGTPISNSSDDIFLRLYRQGEKESFLDLPWSALKQRAEQLRCDDDLAPSPKTAFQIRLCDGSLGPITLINKVEGRQIQTGETKSSSVLNRILIDDRKSALDIHLY